MKYFGAYFYFNFRPLKTPNHKNKVEGKFLPKYC